MTEKSLDSNEKMNSTGPEEQTKVDSDWKSVIRDEWRARRSAENLNGSTLFPLAMNPFGEEEILAMVNVLLSGRLTLGNEVEKVERKFAQMLDVPYAIMVNSGSSANLLSVSAIANKLRRINCIPGDEVLVPSVCWSTSVFPIIQHGLKPVFVDVDPRTFNVTFSELEKKMTSKVKAVMAVHVLGNSIDMRDLMKFVKNHNLILIEDTCESLGSYALTTSGQQKMLGTFGNFGTFSFYFSHHITSGEGGMVVCHDEDDYNLVRCLRAHGWTRHLTNREKVESSYVEIDPRFLFINLGYNLRPLEVQAAMLNVQLDKLHRFNDYRRENLRRITEAISKNDKILQIMSAMQASEGVDPAWFGLAILLHRAYAHQRGEFLEYLTRNGVENRPIISGNFTRQPCISLFSDENEPGNYTGAEAIHARGFFIGIHQIPLDDALIQKLINIIASFSFEPYNTIIVTGGQTKLAIHIQEEVKAQSSTSNLDRRNDSSMPVIIKAEGCEWIFLTDTDGDLSKESDVRNIFRRFQPTHVLHCSGFLENIQNLPNSNTDQRLHNFQETMNILEITHDFQRWNGTIKLLTVLSNPNFEEIYDSSKSDHSIVHRNLYFVPNTSFSTQFLFQLSDWYRKNYKCHFNCILVRSIFGPYDGIGSSFGTRVNDILLDILNKLKVDSVNLSSLKVSLNHLRNSVYVKDLARIAIWTINNYNGQEDITVPALEISIPSILEIIGVLCGSPQHIDLPQDDVIVNTSINCDQFLPFTAINTDLFMTTWTESIKSTMEWLLTNK